MKAVALLVSFLLTLSLLVQNTCPHGYAGKTSVVRACGHCPHRLGLDQPASAKTANMTPTVKKQASSLPLFVLGVQEKMLTLRPAPVETIPAFLTNRYQDAEPCELLRPPQA